MQHLDEMREQGPSDAREGRAEDEGSTLYLVMSMPIMCAPPRSP
jgi:hypothetical protein